MNRASVWIRWMVLVLLLVACAPASNTQNRPTRTDRSVISAEELQAANQNDVCSVVELLRPQWLRPRGISSINQRESVKVYLDDSLVGGPESLRQISTRSVSSIRFLDGLEATQRWGLDHGLGAIQVFTRRN
ncbi:hypothetical protein BH20GEM2_BH20GEM2_14860 [soil metagenome]|nr:hypothetical protein [Gemmatimonadota bacterium]